MLVNVLEEPTSTCYILTTHRHSISTNQSIMGSISIRDRRPWATTVHDPVPSNISIQYSSLQSSLCSAFTIFYGVGNHSTPMYESWLTFDVLSCTAVHYSLFVHFLIFRHSRSSAVWVSTTPRCTRKQSEPWQNREWPSKYCLTTHRLPTMRSRD